MLKTKITLLFMMLGLGVMAQEIRPSARGLEHRLGLAIGLGSVRWLDQNSSPLDYISKPKNVRLFYSLENRSMLVTVDLDVKMGGTRAKYLPGRTVYFQEENYKGKKEDKKFPVGGSFLAGKLSVGAFYKIDDTSSSKIAVAAGVKLSNEMFYPQGWVSSGLFNAISFSPAVYAQHTIDPEQAIVGTFSLPVATYLSRLSYHNTVSAPNKTLMEGFFRNSAWTGAGGFFAPSIELQYRYQFNNHVGSALSYGFNYYSIQQPKSMRATSHAVLGSIYNTF
jgi:hypothetical protein